MLATLPGNAARRVPLRLRKRTRLLAALAAVAIVASGVVLALEGADRVEKGTGASDTEPAPAGTRSVSVKRTAANDYDPAGDGDEHGGANELARAVDRDPGTVWSTETYQDGQLAGKPGVGLYIDAAPQVAAASVLLRTPEPGWKATIYAADEVPDDIGGWTQVGEPFTVRKSKQRVELDTGGTAYRYYLVWITGLPPDGEKVEIAEVGLYRKISS